MKVTASFIATAILLTGSICAYSQSEISVYGGSTRQIPINDLTTEGEIVFYTIHLMPVALGRSEFSVTLEYSGAALALRPLENTGDIPTAELMIGDVGSNGAKIWSPTGIYYSYKPQISNGPWTRVTARIDPKSGVWDLFIGDSLMLANLRLFKSDQSASIPTVSSASDGEAKVRNYALSSENPHSRDKNKNAIPDAFEEAAGVNLGSDRNSAVSDAGQSLLEAYLTDRVN